MKLFYLLALVIGLWLAIVMQFVSIAIPSDAFVAYSLSEAPAQWSIQLDQRLASHLPYHDVKSDVVKALSKRAGFVNEIYAQTFLAGLGLTGFSILGLARERKIRKLVENKRISS